MLKPYGVLKERVVAGFIRESGGPTVLEIGAIANGEYARRAGATLDGDTPDGGEAGSSPTEHTTNATLTAPAGRSRHVGVMGGGDFTLTLRPVAEADATAEIVIVKKGAADVLHYAADGEETVNGSTGAGSLTEDGSYVILWPTTGGWICLNPTYTRE